VNECKPLMCEPDSRLPIPALPTPATHLVSVIAPPYPSRAYQGSGSAMSANTRTACSISYPTELTPPRVVSNVKTTGCY